MQLCIKKNAVKKYFFLRSSINSVLFHVDGKTVSKSLGVVEYENSMTEQMANDPLLAFALKLHCKNTLLRARIPIFIVTLHFFCL